MEEKRHTTCTLSSLKYAICDNQNEALKHLAKVSVLSDILPICGYEKAPEKMETQDIPRSLEAAYIFCKQV